jgi:hypothetical protein
MPHAFIPAPNCAQVELIYLSQGELCENVFKVQKGSPYTLAQLQSLRGTVNTWDSTTGNQLRSSGVQLVRIRSRGIDSASDPVEDYTLPTPRNGTQAGTMLPNNVTFCFKLPTGLAGRSYRGRWYQVGLTTGFIGADANHMNPVSAANALAALNALPTALTAAGHTLVVVSYRHDKAWRTTAVVTPALPFVYVDLAFDSQRRRLTGRGHP